MRYSSTCAFLQVRIPFLLLNELLPERVALRNENYCRIDIQHFVVKRKGTMGGGGNTSRWRRSLCCVRVDVPPPVCATCLETVCKALNPGGCRDPLRGGPASPEWGSEVMKVLLC